MNSSILVLGAVALIFVLVLFGFLLGLLRGFRKSLYFTIVFIVVVVLSFIFATVLAKSVYNGSTLWKVAKKVIPESMKEGSESVNSLKEFVRFYLTHNYTEVLENGMTAGESIVANENAMGIIDGLFVMILKIAMLIGCYIFLTVIFYLLFGLIYILFLRQKPYIETTTTTDEDGNESVEEKEVKPNKKRLGGGLIGAAKGFIKAMIILIPISFAIGMIAQVEIPTNSSTINAEVRYSTNNSSTKTLEEIVNACKKYDRTIGKMQLGLDDFVMDKIISYDVKDANGKKVKVVLRKEISGFIDIYNTIEKEIGVDNLKDYDFKKNIDSDEMKAIVESVTKNVSNSKAITTLLTAVGEEGKVILEDKVAKDDKDIALLFSQVKLEGKDSKWWSEQIAQINDIYKSFANMKLNFDAVDSKEYNLVFKDTSSELFNKFVDEVFENELLEMLIGGGLKYAAKKLPENMQEMEDTTNKIVEDKEVDKELKAFSKLIDIIRDDLHFKDGEVDTDSLTVNTLNKLVETEVLINSKLASKLTTVLIKNTISDLVFDGEEIAFDTTIFDDASFHIHNEVKSLAQVLTDGFTSQGSISKLTNFSEEATVGELCNMLESKGLESSKICVELFGKILPKVLTTLAPNEDFDNLVWTNEFKSISGVLESLYDRENDHVKDLSSIDFDSLTYYKLNALSDNDKVWGGMAVTKLLNGLALPFINTIDIDGTPISLNYDKDKIIWRNELKGIVNVGIWVDNPNNVIDASDYEKPVSNLVDAFGDTIKVKVLDMLGAEVQESKKTELLHAVANGALNSIFNDEVGDSRKECPALASVAYTLADNDGMITLSELDNLTVIYVSTINALNDNIGDSIVLMDKMANNLSAKMSTPSMLDTNNRSAWNSTKWNREMPRIGEVLKSLAKDDDSILIDDASMGEDSEIKKVTFERLEDNIAYSEALQHMFSSAFEPDSDNPYDLPDPEFISGNQTFSAWWDAEITGLANVMYAEMYIDEKDTVKLSEFSDTDTTKVYVIKSLSNPAKHHKTNVQKEKNNQETNIGVSEYLQYYFKPQFRDLSKNTDSGETKYFEFESTYNWDYEISKTMNVYLITQAKYEDDELVELVDTDTVTFTDEVNFRLLDAEVGIRTALEASVRNKAILESISLNIDDNTYLQYVLAPEMKRMMNGYNSEYAKYIAKDPTSIHDNETGWTNSEWVNETSLLNELAQELITEESPKMEGIGFYDLTQDEIDLICDITPKSYLLQSKMAKPLVEAGINNSAITSVKTLIGEEMNLMEYIVKYEWNNDTNEAYEAVMETLNSKREELKQMKSAEYDYDSINDTCEFVNGENTIVIIYGSTGLVTDKNGDPFLTDSVYEKLDAIKTYAEYAMMHKSLGDNAEANPTDLKLPVMVSMIAYRCNKYFIYSE